MLYLQQHNNIILILILSVHTHEADDLVDCHIHIILFIPFCFYHHHRHHSNPSKPAATASSTVTTMVQDGPVCVATHPHSWANTDSQNPHPSQIAAQSPISPMEFDCIPMVSILAFDTRSIKKILDDSY